ncbi:MAG: hypothetical protein COB04_00170 [Gammaproteobacteria bacterium]|nr:MAG: hypothetical protein COB04_00170 [Gammaproteobacteria bacterium]
MSPSLVLGYFIVKPRFYLILIIGMLLLNACSSSPDLKELVTQNIAATRQQMDYLSDSLQSGELRNGIILGQYADIIARQRPEIADLAYSLSRDAKPEGSLYKNLQKRLRDVADFRENSLGQAQFPTLQGRLDELTAIRVAASSEMFNDALSDPVNVLADLSGGSLARVNAISQEQERLSDGAVEDKPGRQLVGNPNYGNWRQDRHGSSFWEWYGKYALFSSLIGGRSYYGPWSYGRGYSYYHDVGRNSYSSPSQRVNQNFVEQKTKKKYRNSGKKFNSPYAKKRAGGSGLSRSSQAQSKKVFTSPYGKQKSSSRSSPASKSKYSSSYSGSARNNTSRTSRGLSGGK